jgi:anti-sigma regulatory factor (Ser/Thr protein kinase)
MGYASNGGRDVTSDHPGVAARRVRRGPDAWVLAVSGELSQRSAGLVSGAVSAALANSGRVLVDVSGLRVTWPPAVQLFGSILADAGGWPGARLVLFGADAALGRLLAALRVSATVPVAPDEITARQLLDRRPRVLARHLDLEQPRAALRRAHAFVRAACADWRLDEIHDDALIVASELVANAVLHAGPGCRLTLRYDAFGLTIAVRDRRPDRLPQAPPDGPQAPPNLSGLFLVAALSEEWGVIPRQDDKTVWAFLPVGDSTTYARAIRKAVRDAVRAVLARGGNTAAAAAAVRQITVRLTEQHGDAAVSDLVDALALELADANTTIALINEAYAEVGDEHVGLDRWFDDAARGFDDPQGSESGMHGP